MVGTITYRTTVGDCLYLDNNIFCMEDVSYGEKILADYLATVCASLSPVNCTRNPRTSVFCSLPLPLPPNYLYSIIKGHPCHFC